MGLLGVLIYRHALVRRQGKLHQGEVPAAEAEDLWGVGFFNRTSLDAFVALWLEHAAEGHEIAHGGAPTLQYDGHGQLWSRYPAEHARLKAGATIRQRNAYFLAASRELKRRIKWSNSGTSCCIRSRCTWRKGAR